MKECLRCKETKPMDEFYKFSRRPDGKDYYCKPCRLESNKKTRPSKEHRSAYDKAWRLANPDRVKEKAKRQYWNNRDKMLLRQAEWAKKNPKNRCDSVKRYRERNLERVREKERVQARKDYERNKAVWIERAAKWKSANPQKAKESSRRFYQANRSKVAIQTKRYYENRKKAVPDWANQFFMEEAYQLAAMRSEMLGVKWVVDHIVPLRSKIVCGLHAHTNLQVIPSRINAIKGNRYWPDMPGAD